MENRKLKSMKTDILIENLKCGGCAATIKKGLLGLDTVETVEIDVEKSLVSVNTTTDELTAVKEKLSKLGYPEVGDKNTVMHKAKSFVSCAVGRMES